MNLRKSFQNITIAFTLFLSFSCQTKNHVKNDKNPFFKGFMIDAARTVENMGHYYRIVDYCADNGFNSILFRITDDEGCAMQFKKHPELIHHVGAFTAEELKAFVKYADKKGIEIIPEVESFGHTKYITQVDRYKSLIDILDTTITWSNGICPVSDTTFNLMKDLYSEVMDIFPSKYFHIGCDETNWGANELTKKALEEKSKNEVWAEYVNKLNAFVKEKGKTSLIWADVPIREENEILDLLDKDIVLIDWNYWYTNEATIKANADKMLNAGFKIIGSPAANWFMWGARMGKCQFGNIKAFAYVYNNLKSDNNMGIIITHWCPYRYAQNGQWDSYALVAEAMNNPDYNMMATLKKFTENHYGVKWNEDWKQIYSDLYQYTPKHKYCTQAGADVDTFYTWKNKEDIIYNLSKKDTVSNHFVKIVKLIKNQASSITENKNDYEEFLLSAEYLQHIVWRENIMFSLKKDNSKIAKTLNYISEKDNEMLKRLDASWKKDRKGEMSSKYMWEFPLAASYSSKLAKDNSELIEILKSLK